jgi:PEP-CTERM motif
VLALASVAMPPAQANLVVNGNFDLDSPPSQTAPVDWTLTPAISGSDFFVGPGPSYGAFSAPNSANFGGTGSTDDVLSQTLATVAGGTYTLSFELAHDATDTANNFSAIWNGISVLSLVNTSTFGYTSYSYTVAATGTSTVLSFAGRENPAWYDLDNVSVVPTTTPEPGSLIWLLAVGFGGLYAFRRRRRCA